MKDDDLDALLEASLADAPRPPDIAFIDHSSRRVALREMLARETRTAVRRGVRDLVLAASFIAMLIVWSGLMTTGYDIAAIILPLLMVGVWSIAYDWSFPAFSLDGEDGQDALAPANPETARENSSVSAPAQPAG